MTMSEEQFRRTVLRGLQHEHRLNAAWRAQIQQEIPRKRTVAEVIGPDPTPSLICQLRSHLSSYLTAFKPALTSFARIRE